MFIRRSDVQSDGCPANRIYCSASGSNEAIVGSSNSGGDPMNSAPTTSDSPPTSYVNKPGLHRYIGIVMVIILLVLVLIGWVWYSQRRKQKREMARRKAELGAAGGDSSPSLAEEDEDMLGEKEKLSNVKSRPITPVISEKERSLMLQSEPRGVVKEVSGGVVMFTEMPKAQPGKDRYPLDWVLERVKGVRDEPRNPRRYSGQSPTTPNKPSSR